jgi:hypothetical protein
MSSYAVLALHNKSQLHHVVPIALALLRQGQDVTVFTSSTESKSYILNLASLFEPVVFPDIQILRSGIFHRIKCQFKERMYPRASLVIKKNLKLLSSFDAIVTPDVDVKPFHSLKKRPKLILTGHGSGYRGFSFARPFHMVDLTLVSGTSLYDQLVKADLVSKDNCDVVGYPKFDIPTLHSRVTRKSLFPESDKPIVLYNPHFCSSLSSWHLWSERIFEFFIIHKEYNLILAPHVLLKEKELVIIPEQVKRASNIFIDLDSDLLIDMTYSKLADLYLGDVSSQVYEFLNFKSRPCIFLNPRLLKWNGVREFPAWILGPVVESFDSFSTVLDSSLKIPDKYSLIQNSELSKIFFRGVGNASDRAAKSIVNYMKNSRRCC